MAVLDITEFKGFKRNNLGPCRVNEVYYFYFNEFYNVIFIYCYTHMVRSSVNINGRRRSATIEVCSVGLDDRL